MVGAPLVLAWSITLTNIGPTPQIIDMGATPTNDAYMISYIQERNVNVTPPNLPPDRGELNMSVGTDPNNPTNLIPLDENLPRYGLFSGKILSIYTDTVIPAGSHLYMQYSGNTNAPNHQKIQTITFDFYGVKAKSQ
jgi:hypothetical protein